jgi:hypothetical protein
MSEQEFAEDMNDSSEDDRHLERLLASLKPRESRVSRDRVMFLAGQASALVAERSRTWRLNRWLWPAATICSAIVGLLIGASMTAGHRIAANPIAVESPPLREQITAASSQRIPAAPRTAQEDHNSEDARALASEEPADSWDSRREGKLELVDGSPFTLLALRDQMLAGRWDDLALAQLDGSAARGGATAEPELPLGARALLRRWITEEGINRR